MAKRTLHPALKQRAAMVKLAHAKLSMAVPGFRALPKTHRMSAVQQHVNRLMKPIRGAK